MRSSFGLSSLVTAVAVVSTACSAATSPDAAPTSHPIAAASAVELPSATPVASASAAPIESAKPKATAPAAPEDVFADSAGAKHRGRVHLIARDGLSLTPGGDKLTSTGGKLPWSLDGVVIDETNELVRIVVTGVTVRLLVYAPPDSTALVPTKTAWLAPKADQKPDESAGVCLAPGVELAGAETKGTVHHVSGSVARVNFDGWIDETALGHVYEEVPFAVPVNPTGEILEGTTVSNTSGDVIAKFAAPLGKSAPQFMYTVMNGTAAKKGFQGIDFIDEHIQVTGLVPSASYRTRKPDSGTFGYGTGQGDGGGMSDTPHAELKPKTPLFDPSGNKIGVTRTQVTAYIMDSRGASSDPHALITVQVHMNAIGFSTVWVHSEDLGPQKPY